MITLNALTNSVPTWLAHAAHDVGLAAWFGGAYMGAVSLNGASREVDDPTQRNRVANAGWFRWAAIVPVAIGLHGSGAVVLSRRNGPPSGTAERGVLAARLGVLGIALLATAGSGTYGRIVAEAGDVPTATAVQPISSTPEEVARAQRILRVLQWVIPAATGTLIVMDAWQQDHGGTCVLPRKWLKELIRH